MNEPSQSFWVVVATSCDQCGSLRSVALFQNKPSEEEKNKVAQILGGMWCIKLSETEIEPGEIIEVDIDAD